MITTIIISVILILAVVALYYEDRKTSKETSTFEIDFKIDVRGLDCLVDCQPGGPARLVGVYDEIFDGGLITAKVILENPTKDARASSYKIIRRSIVGGDRQFTLIVRQSGNPSVEDHEDDPAVQEPSLEEGNVPGPEPTVEPTVECHAETHRLHGASAPADVTGKLVLVGTYDINHECGCQWTVTSCEGADFLSGFVFEDGKIMAKVSMANQAARRTSRYTVRHTGKGGERYDFFDVDQDEYSLEKYISRYRHVVDVAPGSVTYAYIARLYDEAREQFFNQSSANGLDYLMISTANDEQRGNVGEVDKAFDTLVGWLISLQLASIRPQDRTEIFAIGYKMGGYDQGSPLYGYSPGLDPNDMRLSAAAIYSAMRGVLAPWVGRMRKDLGGTVYQQPLKDLAAGKRDQVDKKDFFIDFRAFMPAAPGPYCPGYTTRPSGAVPADEKDEYLNLKADRDWHEKVVETFNFDAKKLSYVLIAEKAVADKDGDRRRLFGITRKTKDGIAISPTFGGISPVGNIAEFCCQMQAAANSARGILQNATESPAQYGRLRPGCSWSMEAIKNSQTDNRRNILTCFDIEEGDGNPTGYYDENGYWVPMNGITGPEDFEEQQRNALYANSYPSGHSSGIMAVAMALSSLRPNRTGEFFAAAIAFSESRSIARYHWRSDVIVGRVLGTAQAAVSEAAADYSTLYENALNEMKLIE